MADTLDEDIINGMPQPFIVRLCGDKETWWPLHDVDVETGLMRINVCGLLEVKRFSEVMEICDGHGRSHNPETFYLDIEECGNHSGGSLP